MAFLTKILNNKRQNKKDIEYNKKDLFEKDLQIVRYL